MSLHGRSAIITERMCAKADEMIYPDDTVRTLLDLQFDCGYLQDFVFGLEAKTGAKFPWNNIPYPPDDRTFAAFVHDLARLRPTSAHPAGGTG